MEGAIQLSIKPDAIRWSTSPWTLAMSCGAVWLIAVITIAMTRSGWVDEFFIARATDPAIPLQEHIAVWRTEPHPPTYTALLWAWRHVFSDSGNMFVLRAFGITASAFLALGALLYWRAAKWPGLKIFALLLFSAPSILFFPGEARSYFLSAFGGVYAALYLTRAFETREPGTPSLPDVAIGVGAAILLSTHLISMAFECLLFGIAVIAMFLQKRWDWLKTTLLIGLFVTGPMIAFTAFVILDGMSRALSEFWITRWQLLTTVLRTPILVGAGLRR